MTDHDRRRVLKYAGLAMTAGGLATGAGTATADGDGTGGRRSVTAAELDGWSSLRGDAGNTGFRPDDDGPDAPVAVAWTYDYGGPLAVVDGIVYLTVDGEVRALDAADGTLVGATDEVGANGAPVVTDDTVYVGGEQLTAIAIEGGEIRWQADLEHEEAIPSPVVADDLVFVVADGTLLALGADDGDEAWRFEPDDPLTEQTVAVADGAVYSTNGETLFAHEVDDGTERWTANGQYRRQVLVASDGLVAASSDGIDGVSVYDAETGETRWEGDGLVPGLATDDRIYVLSSSDLRGYDRESGDETWRPGIDASFTAPVADGETVYAGHVGSDEGAALSAFDDEDGSLEWLVETDSLPRHLALDDGTIYASAGGLLAIRAEDDLEDDDGDEDDGGEGDGSDDNEDGGDDEDGLTDDGDDDGNGEANESDEDGGSDGDETGSDGVDDNESDAEDDETADGGSDQDDTDESGDGDDEEDDTDEDEVFGGDDNGTDDGNESDAGDDETPDENGSDENGSDEDDGDASADDGVPGFTAGAGLAGGALTLEWLRRRGLESETERETE